MLMNSVFNTPFETGLRLLLILYITNSKGLSVDRLAAYDFITLYGKDFDITDTNLNGMNSFNFSEIPTRREICVKGIKEFALDGLIKVERSKNGFKYKISEAGKVYVESLDSDYSKQYISTVMKVLNSFDNVSDSALVKEINSKAVQALRR